ncbi:hypothetical protein [Streptomyces sp. NPDC051001]
MGPVPGLRRHTGLLAAQYDSERRWVDLITELADRRACGTTVTRSATG